MNSLLGHEFVTKCFWRHQHEFSAQQHAIRERYGMRVPLKTTVVWCDGVIGERLQLNIT